MLNIHPSRIFLYACLSFIGGVALSSAVVVPELCALAFMVFGVALVSIFWTAAKGGPGPSLAAVNSGAGKVAVSRFVVVGTCLLMFGLGIYRHQIFDRPKDSQDYYKNNYSDISERTPGNFLSAALYSFRGELGETIDSSLSPPYSSILGAMMLGENDRLSYELKDELNRSGTRHIISISGMHVVVLANMIIGLCILFGLYRGKAFYFAVGFIVLYVIMVGAPASAVRAGIMGGIVFFAQKTGRVSQSKRLLVLAAALMLAVNPLIMKFDIGFQLSFLATLGIAMTSSWVREKLFFVPNFLDIRNTISMTIPATLFTAPILAFNFEQFSIISLPANILVVPARSFVF